MIKKDRQLGTPHTVYRDTSANLELIDDAIPGAIAYATDLNAFGVYKDTGWDFGAGDKSYVHYQLSPAEEWMVQHNLNKNVSVMVVDSAGSVVQGDISYTDNNNLVISFSSSFSGRAFCN